MVAGLGTAEPIQAAEVSPMSSGMPLKNLFSLIEPLGPPSPEAPLSDTSTTIRLSSWPDSSR